MRSLPCLFLSLTLTACGVSAPPATSTPSDPVTPPTVRKVRFIAFGDAGRADETQNAVGTAMAQLCAIKGCDFAIELGDNFYDSGVDSVTDEQWQSKFELPYKDLDFPIYPALGNHDNSGLSAGDGNDNTKGENQVAYTTAANSSGKWQLPSRYHAYRYPADLKAGENPIVELFVLDSNPMAATIPDLVNTQYNYITYANTQLQWFQAGLAASKAKWTIAYSHHPYICNGEHGNAGEFDGVPANFPGTTNGKPWKDFFEASACDTQYNGGLDFYIFGHDHDLEWLKPTASCNDKTQFILSGAGSTTRAFGDAERNPTYWQQDQTSGFFWFEITDTSFTGEAYPLVDLKLPLDAQGKPLPAFTKTQTK